MTNASGLVSLIRWPGAITAAGNAAAAFLLAHRPDSPGGLPAALGAVTGAVLLYSGGVVLNDVADAAKDATSHPRRPIPSGRAGRRDATRFGIALIVCGVASFALLGGPAAGGLAAIAALFAVAYDFVARGVRLAGAALLGGARAANALAGAAAAAGALPLVAGEDVLASRPVLFAGALFAWTFVLVWISTYEDEPARPWFAPSGAMLLWLTATVPWGLFGGTTWPLAPALPYLLLAGTLALAAADARTGGGPGLGALVRAGVFGFLLVDSAWLFGAGWYQAGIWAIVVHVVLRLVLLRARS